MPWPVACFVVGGPRVAAQKAMASAPVDRGGHIVRVIKSSFFAQGGDGRKARPRNKKPMRQNTRRYSDTSVYFLTSLLAPPGCPSSSHPKKIDPLYSIVA